MSESLDPSSYHELLRRFLEEDFGAGDITTDTIVAAGRRGQLIAKAPLVLAGIDLFTEVFRLLDPTAAAEIGRKDGNVMSPGESPVQVFALARTLLSGETRGLEPVDWLMIQHTMWNYVGLIRSERRLNRAMRILRELDLEIARFYEKCEVSDSIIGLRNGILTALLILEAAQQSRESRGCHYRIN